MRIKIIRSKFVDGLKKVQNVVAGKGSMQIIQNAITTVLEGRTSIVVAHRLSTIRNADRILVIKGGAIVESGTHDELLEKGGSYHDLYVHQFREETLAQALV